VPNTVRKGMRAEADDGYWLEDLCILVTNPHYTNDYGFRQTSGRVGARHVHIRSPSPAQHQAARPEHVALKTRARHPMRRATAPAQSKKCFRVAADLAVPPSPRHPPNTARWKGSRPRSDRRVPARRAWRSPTPGPCRRCCAPGRPCKSAKMRDKSSGSMPVPSSCTATTIHLPAPSVSSPSSVVSGPHASHALTCTRPPAARQLPSGGGWGGPCAPPSRPPALPPGPS
jgi:hypothetical protein